jgi:hypothetical protein
MLSSLAIASILCQTRKMRHDAKACFPRTTSNMDDASRSPLMACVAKSRKVKATSSLPIHRKKASLSLKDTHYMDNLPKRLVLSSGLTSPFFLLICYYEMYKGEE